jgi:hypothetical protein
VGSRYDSDIDGSNHSVVAFVRLRLRRWLCDRSQGRMAVMVDREKFFGIIKTLFGGRIDASQIAGINAILDEAEKRGLLDTAVGKRKVAYMLATAKIETNATYQPVREAYWLSEDWRRRNLRYYPYYGRGLPQLTWERNYRKMTEVLRDRFKHIPDFDLVKNPDQALMPEVAIAVMFEGMLNGHYTGKALKDYFTDTKSEWVAARWIVNGTDRADEIGDVGRLFYAALEGEDKLPARMLRYGMAGEDVKELQRLLGINPDGDFGPKTEEAVRMFQAEKGIGADGIAGPVTLNLLRKA